MPSHSNIYYREVYMDFKEFITDNNNIQWYYNDTMVLKCRRESDMVFIIPLYNNTEYGHITLPNLPENEQGREKMITLYYNKIKEFVNSNNEQSTTN